jgi:iron complex outermembrane receptor protein
VSRRSAILTALFGALLWVQQARADDEEETLLIEEIRPDAPDPSRTAAALTTIPIDDSIPEFADLTRVLDSTSGTTVVQLGGLGDYAGLSIRGSSLQQVEIYLDGIPLNPDGSSTVNLAELPLRAFDRVEIYRSLPPLWMGSAAMGGAVNLVSRQDSVPPRLSSTGASHQTGRLHGTTSLESEDRPLDILVFGEAFTTAGNFDYFDDNGTLYNTDDDGEATRQNNDKLQLSTHGRMRWGSDSFRLSLLDAFLSREEGVPGHVQISTEEARLKTTRNLLAAQLASTNTQRRSTANLYWLVRAETLDDRTGELALTPYWKTDDFQHIGLSMESSWAVRDWLVPAAALHLREDRFQSADLRCDQVQDPRRRRVGSLSIGADLLLLEDRLGLSPALRGLVIDNRAIEGTPFADTPLVTADTASQQALSPRLGLLYRPLPSLTLKATAGQYLRPPDLGELFGDRGGIVGNASLRPESGTQLDAGLRWTRAGAATQSILDLSAFSKHAIDLVVYEQNSQRTLTPRNVGEARVMGLEAALQIAMLERVDWLLNLSLTESENLETDPAVAGNQLPRIPSLSAHNELRLHWEERIALGHQWSFSDGNYWDATNWYRASPRSLHSVFVQARPRPRWPTLELTVQNLANRITEEVPRNPLDPEDESTITQSITDFVGYPLPGRTWLLSLRWTGTDGDT